MFTDYREKYCILLFDEMKLSGSLHYNKSFDYIEGVLDIGFYRNENIANYVQVFMVKGIHGSKTWSNLS